MYDFSILTPAIKGPEIDFEEYDINSEDTVASVTQELTDIALNMCITGDLITGVKRLGRTISYIQNHGCTKELVAILGRELEAHDIVLNVEDKTESEASLEGLMDKLKDVDIKATLMKILDAIIRIIQKFVDQNRKDANEIKGLLKTKLSDLAKIDAHQFSNVYATLYPVNDFFKVVEGLAKLDLGREIKANEDLGKAIQPNLKGILKAAGYVIDDSMIVRDPDFSIPRARMSEHNWEPGKVRDAAMHTVTMLEHIRLHNKNTTDNLKTEINNIKDADKAEELKLVLAATAKVITIIERISLIMSKQVIVMTGMFKDKQA